ncbi:toll-like receptor 13 [Diadema setosum]|uniref:toll-like receptor 13 n=1 Tax=Diadema setosum TaxID=31175 RepID=UPI003B3BD69B
MAGGTAVTVLTALMTLSCIAGHWIQTHPKCFFSYPSPLPNADCSHLNLSAVPQTLPSNLYQLDLSYNDIVTITDVSFVRYRKIQILLLPRNTLNRIDGKSFELLRDLRVLYMSYNNISRLPDALFHKNVRLSLLDLSHNRLTEIPNNALGSIRELTLKNNIISLFDRNLLKDTPKLLTLYLRANHLTTISADTFMPETLVRLDISRNPLTCDCSLAWFRNWFQTTNVNISPDNETLCSQTSFKQLVNVPLQEFHPDDFCGIDVQLILGLILGSIMVTCMGLLIYRKRWWLNYKIFLLKLFVLGYKQQEEDRQADDYEYQLNIMCHDDDDDWVHSVLRPAFEERMPHLQRVAYGDEALRVSMYYIDAIYHIVENSYKTVLLLSNHCTDDAWFITKVRVALEHVNETGLDKVILVFLEDIPSERLPYLVRLFLSRDRPNLLWTEDCDGQDLFWAHFEKCMRSNLQINHALPI